MKASILIALLQITALQLIAQGPMQLSLSQAKELAAKQSYQVQVSQLEADKARKQISEVLAAGLPQINGSVSLQHYLDVPTQVVPNFFGSEPEVIELQFGVPWSANAGVRLDQLIFDGSYILGLKAAKEVRKRSDEELELNMLNARAQAAKAYYGVLAADEGARLVGESLPLLERSLAESEAMLKAGFIEGIDVDRLNIELAQARDQHMVFQRQADLARNYLKFVLGLPVATPIELTDNLQGLIDDTQEVALAQEDLAVEQHVESRMANTLLRVQTLNMRNGRAAYLPNLSAFFAHQQQWNATDFEPIDGPIPWFPATLWGVNLNVPIFSSGMRSSRLAQGKIALEQAEVNRTLTDERLRLDHAQRQSDVITALDLYNNELERLELSKNIFDRTSLKFTEGVASSFELTQEQGQYLAAQQRYIQRVVELVNARTELRRSLDRF